MTKEDAIRECDELQAALDTEREAHTETELALELERERVETLREALTDAVVYCKQHFHPVLRNSQQRVALVEKCRIALAETEPAPEDPVADATERLMEDFDRAINKLKDA